MNRHPRYILCLAAVFAASILSGPALLAQTDAANSAAKSNPPVAFVYVLSNFTGSTNHLLAFAADSSGKLTSLHSSPVKANLSNMAVNGRHLYGSKISAPTLPAFAIAADGNLKYIRGVPSGGADCGSPGPVIFDHTGTDLYVSVSTGGECDYSAYLTYTGAHVGKLKYAGTTAGAFLYNTPLSFIGNNVFAYGSACVDYQGGYLDTFAGYRRGSNGVLTNASINAPTPSTGHSGTFYCRSLTAADPANHLAVSMQQIDNSSDSAVGMPQLGVYSADSHGNLTTTSTGANMPTTAVGYVSNLSMSPSGKLLAVGGSSGLQIFHFNGANPITHYTGLLTTDSINQVNPSNSLMYWDHANHLYAISPTAGKLFVFTITPTSVSQAPGSPYTITNPQTLMIQPK